MPKKVSDLLLLKYGCTLYRRRVLANMRWKWSKKGKIEAALEPYQLHDNPNMRYLMRDFRQAEKQFFRRTGAYTLNHLFALREETAKEYPAAVSNLFAALKKQTLWRTDIAMKSKKTRRLGKRK